MSDLKATLNTLRELSLSELKSVQSRCLYLIGTKHQEESRDQEIDRLITERNESREDGLEWVRPSSALDAYPLGAVVTYQGAHYRSTVGANVWRPTESGWRELADGDAPPPYEAPTGAHDAYQQGERVAYEGAVYEAVRDGVVHSPSEYPDDWQSVEPEDDGSDDEDSENTEDPDDDDEDDSEPEPEDPEVPEWNPGGHEYKAGDLLSYEGITYRVIQYHTSQAGWTPDAVPALYEVVDS